jgi:hypothetical protein
MVFVTGGTGYIGTPHPNPSKAAEFERVDLQSIRTRISLRDRRAKRSCARPDGLRRFCGPGTSSDRARA